MASDGASPRPAALSEPTNSPSSAGYAADRPSRRTRFAITHQGSREREWFVLDLFRLLSQFRATYDPRALENAAEHAARGMGRLAATDPDGLMAGAVLLDNELRCHNVTTYAAGLPGSTVRSDQEDAFVLLLKACGVGGSERVAIGAAVKLGVDDSRALLSCAAQFTRRLGWPARGPGEPLRDSKWTEATVYSRTQA